MHLVIFAALAYIMKRISVLFLISIISISVSAQYQNVKIGESTGLHRGICEPSIAISKKNKDKLVAGAILNRVFYSKDGGLSWEADLLESSYGVWGDPVVISDFKGNFYYLHLSDPTGLNWASEEILDRIVCQKSKNGKKWNDGSYMGLNHPKDQDKHWAIACPKTGNIYVTWTQFDKYGSNDPKYQSNILFAKSEDKGKTWSKEVILSQVSGDCVDGDNTTEGAVPAVSPDGEIYVAWSNRGKIYFDRSIDEGNTWLEEDKVVADHIGGWEIEVPGLFRANGMPITVCDVSEGPFRGTIYVNWVDNREGHYDVWVSKSADRGETWSEPLRVNDDFYDADQFFTWMTCDPVTGDLYCVFYDRRNYVKGTDLNTDVYMAYSKDGGTTWVNEKISEKPFVPNDKIFFGDYNSIDAYDGIVRPIWTRMDQGGKMSIWTALINMKIE